MASQTLAQGPVRVLFVFGTRPEAIKLCPVVRHMRERAGEFDVRVCATAQHREMLDQVLAAFGVQPDYDLDVMRPARPWRRRPRGFWPRSSRCSNEAEPRLILVQGDTTTTLCGALAGFYHKIPVAHVEAGLRTGDIWQPFPEEMNRVLTTRLAALHFAPTETAARNLRRRPGARRVHRRHRQHRHRRRALRPRSLERGALAAARLADARSGQES